MNPLGVHALVFAGSWGRKERERAVSSAARLGYDLIEIPLLDPKAVDAAATVKLLDSIASRVPPRSASTSRATSPAPMQRSPSAARPC